MHTLARAARRARQWASTFKPLPEPEPVYAPQPRPMTGLFASLSSEQQRKALAYKGEENHGDTSFKLISAPLCN